jgi:hypothetical protein
MIMKPGCQIVGEYERVRVRVRPGNLSWELVQGIVQGIDLVGVEVELLERMRDAR